jgi:hypothetical protein
MDKGKERRTEQRLHYHWPIWFAEDFNKALSQGQMVDISSRGAAFTCHADENCPYLGQHVTARFSVPRFGPGDCFDMANFTRIARICKVNSVNRFLRRIVIQFAEPLPFKPGEQSCSESDAQKALNAATL